MQVPASLIALGLQIVQQARKAYIQSRKGIRWVKKIIYKKETK